MTATVVAPVAVDQALAQIKKGQQLAGHFPDAEALDRAQRVIVGEITHEQGLAELDRKWRRRR